MTPKEAAAKCREWADLARDIRDDADLARFHQTLGVASTWEAAAALIDQIGVPQPWPPPEDVSEVLAYQSKIGMWMGIGSAVRDSWLKIDQFYGPFSHWLPMPAAPEVKG